MFQTLKTVWSKACNAVRSVGRGTRHFVVAAVTAVAVSLAMVPGVSYAVDPVTLADLTTGISLTTTTLAVLAVAGLVIGFKVVKQGAVIVLRFLGFIK